jgi:hypothetical protein
MPKSPNANITPLNGVAVVPAGQDGTLFINLWNDGQLGFYNFSPMQNRQNGLQSLLDNLSNLLGTAVADIESTVNQIENFVGSIPTDVQNALDSVQNLIGGIPGQITNFVENIPVVGPVIGAGLQDVAQSLNYFNGLAQNLANALGINNILSEISSTLRSWETTISNDIQSAVDAVAQQFGFTGLNQPLDLVSSALNALQPAVQILSDVLSGNWIPAVVSVISDFTGTIDAGITAAGDAITSVLGAGTGLGLGGLSSLLTDFQGLLDNVAGAVGIGGTGNTIFNVLGGLVPHIFGTLSNPITSAINAVIHFLGHTPFGNIVEQLIGLLLSLIGNLTSQYATDAQLFVMVQPMLQ